MTSINDYYEALDLKPGCSKEEIKQAYRKLAQRWHPDKFSKQPDQLKAAREKFESIKAAYENLIAFSEPEIRSVNSNISVQASRAEADYEDGSRHLREGSYRQAVDSFTQAIRKQPNYLKAYQARAFVLEQLGLKLRAQADFDKVAELKRYAQSPSSKTVDVADLLKDAEVYFQRGLEQFKARQYGAAIENLTLAIRIKPRHIEAYRYRSQAYFHRGYDDRADADFKHMRELERQTKASAATTDSSPSKSGSLAWQCTQTLTSHTERVATVAIARDGKKLISGSYDKTLKLWHAETGRLLKTLSGHTQAVHCLAISWDGKCVASGSADKTIKIWDVRTGRLLQSLGGLFSGHTDTVTALAFSPNGKVLASTSLDRTVRLWDLKSGKAIYGLKNATAPILTLAMSWDGKTMAYGGKGNLLSLCRTKTGKLMQSFPIHSQPCLSVALSRQSTFLAAGSSAEILLWDRHHQNKMSTLKGHAKPVSALAFSADSQMLVSGSHDKTLKLWSTHTGENINTLRGHQDAIYSIAYSLDSKRIVSGSADKTIKIWQQV
ncbi:MAG: DnaJ domain-containing protein [Cyanobacteria bacterium P01_A01_bin.114]